MKGDITIKTKKQKDKRKIVDESVDQLKKTKKKKIKVEENNNVVVKDVNEDTKLDNKRKKSIVLEEATENMKNEENKLKISKTIKKPKMNDDAEPKQENEKQTVVSDNGKNTTDPDKKSKKRKINKSKHKRNSKHENKKAKQVLESLLTNNDSEKVKNEMENIDGEDEKSVVEDNIESEKKPKKKKKTKAEIPKDDPDNEPQKSEAAKKQAISYLLTWKNDKSNWSFKKAKQIWLIKNMYSSGAIDDKNFTNLVEYLEGSKGAVRTRLTETAQNIYDALANKEDVDETDNVEIIERDRARVILQALSE